jgi:predicted transcriptional regulator
LANRRQIAWRRNKAEELLIKGNNQVQIAQILQVSEATVSSDIAYLREQSRQNMASHIADRLPREFENCMSGINQILRISWEIATRDCSEPSDNINSNKIKMDDKTRLQALALANECYKYKMDLVTNGVVVADSVKFVMKKKEEVQKLGENNTNDTSNKPNAENLDSIGTTTNKIF